KAGVGLPLVAVEAPVVAAGALADHQDVNFGLSGNDGTRRAEMERLRALPLDELFVEDALGEKTLRDDAEWAVVVVQDHDRPGAAMTVRHQVEPRRGTERGDRRPSRRFHFEVAYSPERDSVSHEQGE